MQKLKVMTVVGTRPEIIRLSEVIKKLEYYESIEHILVHTGQNYDYELNEVFFKDLEIRKPDHFLNAAGSSTSETIGQIIIKTDQVLNTVQPDALLILGDTNSCLAIIPAKRRKIPTFHMEAGNRCFDQRVPEEINRRIVDHTADINLPYSSIAREYLLREGIPPEFIIKTGSPMFEVLHNNRKKIESSSVLEEQGLEAEKYFVVSAHREENVDSDSRLSKLADILNGIEERYGMPVIVSTHPRTRKRIENTGTKFNERVLLLKPLGFFDYNCLQLSAKAVLSDSGTITEESSILGFPALNIREAHERPEGMEEGSVMMVGISPQRVFQALSVLDSQKQESKEQFEPALDYTKPNVSEKIVRIILSYTDYIKRNVWKEY